MAILSESETEACDRNPIKDGLDGFLDEFELKFKSFSLTDFKALLRSDEVQYTVGRLIAFLSVLSATSCLPSRHSSKHLGYDLVILGSRNSSGSLNVEASAVLLERVINHSPDHDIWCAVYDLVTPATPPLTPRVPVTSVTETPFQISSGALHNTDEARSCMDTVIENEMKDHIYLDLPAFFETFFDSVDGLPHLVDAVFARCLQSTSYVDTSRWSAFPSSCVERNIITWFQEEVARIVGFASDADQENMHASVLTSRRVISMAVNPLPGSTAHRKLDIGFAASNRADDATPVCRWDEVLVPGALKEKREEDLRPSTWYDLGRYVREVYSSQDTRRFCHGFTLCGDVMRVWRFDREGIYSAPPFSVNEDGRRFVTVVLGYLLMGNDDLGSDTTTAQDGDRRYVPVIRDGVEERLFIERPMHRQACILGRATTCWRAILEGSTRSFVIKDSWQHYYDGKDDEGDLLMDVASAGVRYVAPCYHCASVRIGGRDDDLRSCVRKDVDLLSGKKWRARKGRAGGVLSTSGSSSTLSKRVASQTLHSERNPKRSRSNTQGDSGNCNPPEDVAQDRIHKRVIMSMCGKQLYLAKTKIGLLQGLIDGITGHENLLREKKILHRDISIGNVLITEDESEGFLIDLDHAVRVDRERSSGAKGRTGTKVFMSIGLLDQNDDQSKRPHSFMDDLESMFWVLFWICVHYSDPSGGWVRSKKYEKWNFRSPGDLAGDKLAAVVDQEDFLKSARRGFTDFYQPLVPWVNRLRREVFPGGLRWRVEDFTLYERMRVVLRKAMEDPAVLASSCS